MSHSVWACMARENMELMHECCLQLRIALGNSKNETTQETDEGDKQKRVNMKRKCTGHKKKAWRPNCSSGLRPLAHGSYRPERERFTQRTWCTPINYNPSPTRWEKVRPEKKIESLGRFEEITRKDTIKIWKKYINLYLKIIEIFVDACTFYTIYWYKILLQWKIKKELHITYKKQKLNSNSIFLNWYFN